MLRSVSKCLLVCLLVCGLSGHWAVLQSVAWTTMLLQNMNSAPLVVALSKTFDGKHPCKICKVVAEGKKAERRQDAQAPQLKIELFCEVLTVRMPVPPQFLLAATSARSTRDRREPPPLPPPRLS
ncbi:MAG TPA: hypothetical protein VMZ27_13220 [Candidatus Saccharimonadales bacterium]|nr:hypothetical protein [Candidatus Saccharimonadales bacterium]